MATRLQLDNLARAVPLAQAAQARFGVPASVTLAQWALESRWGQSQLAVKANNFFGIKAVEGEAYSEFPTREAIAGRTVVELAHFAFYPTPAESFLRHVQLLASLPRYERAMLAAFRPLSFCEELQAGGYSTDPHYAETLQTLIRQFDLGRYDAPTASTSPSRTTL